MHDILRVQDIGVGLSHAEERQPRTDASLVIDVLLAEKARQVNLLVPDAGAEETTQDNNKPDRANDI